MSQNNSFDLIERDLIVASVIELCRARAFVRRHLLGVFQQPAVEQIDGDPGRPERVAAKLGDDPGLFARVGRSCAARPAGSSASRQAAFGYARPTSETTPRSCPPRCRPP